MKKEIAARLEAARQRRGRSIRSLQQALHDEDVPGSSYANVYAYMKGRTQPSIEFLAAAAEELEVNPAWLAFGPPHHMTEEEEIAAEGSGTQPAPMTDVADALRESFPAIGRQVSGPALSAALRAWERVMGWRAGRDGNAGELVDVAREVGEALQAPLRILGVKHRELSPWALDWYAVLAAQAIEIAVATPNLLEPQPLLAAQEEEEETNE